MLFLAYNHPFKIIVSIGHEMSVPFEEPALFLMLHSLTSQTELKALAHHGHIYSVIHLLA